MVHEDLTIQGIVDIRSVWEEVSPLLEPGIDPKEYDLIEVFMELQESKMQLWVAREGERIIAAMTTKIVVYPVGKILMIMHMGGKWDGSFRNYLPRLKQFGKSHGCKALRIIGRRGWERVLKEHLTAVAVVMESEL